MQLQGPPAPTSRAQLEQAIDKVRLRFGDQALLRAARVPAAQPWPTGVPGLDRLAGIGGLPCGRLSILQGPTGSGKLSIGLAILAAATRELAQAVVIDTGQGFDAWAMQPMRPDLDRLAVVRPPNAEVAGEAAVALARAGAGLLLVLGELPEAALAPLESAASRSGSLLVACAGRREAPLAHASSLTLEFERVAWLRDRGEVNGIRTRVGCIKNKLAAPGAETELEVRYPLGANAFPERPVGIVTQEGAGRWVARSAVG